jgi:hypothetical protein
LIKDKDGETAGYKIKSFELVECSPCLIGAHESAIIAGQKATASAAARLQIFALPKNLSWLRTGTDDVMYTMSLEAEVKSAETDQSQEAGEAAVPSSGDPTPPSPSTPEEQAHRKAIGADQEADGAGEAEPVQVPSDRDAMIQATATLKEATTAFNEFLQAASHNVGHEKDQADSPAPPASAVMPTAQTLDHLTTLAPTIREAIRQVLSGPEFVAMRDRFAQEAVRQIAAANKERRTRRYGTGN